MTFFLPLIFLMVYVKLLGGIKIIFLNLVVIALFGWLTSFNYLSFMEIVYIEISGALLIIILLVAINLRNKIYMKQNLAARHLILLGIAIAVVIGAMVRPGLGAVLGWATSGLGIGKIYTEHGLWGFAQLYGVTFIQFTGSLFIAFLLIYFLIL